MLKTKTKSIAKYFIAILSIVFVFAAAISVSININKLEPQDNNTPIIKTTNNLTLNSGFTDNQYVVINGKAYGYMPSSATQSVEQTNSVKFNTNNTVELIFLKDSITQLSNFALLDNNIASVLQATKTDNGVNINILYTEQTASIETSHDAEYTLGTQALNTNNILNYANQEFTIGTTKGPTSLLDATTAETAKVLNLTGGTFELKNTTYTGNGSGRAIYQTGGNLTLNNITLTRFSSASNGGAIYTSSTTTITGGTYTSNTVSVRGGAIYSTGTLTISSATISNNTAVTGGGGLAQLGGTATLTSVTMKDNITTTTYGHAFYGDNGATITVNSGTYETQNSSYKAATVIVGNATVNLVGGTFKGYNYAFDCYTANGANAKYVLKGNPTIETTSGNHFWISTGTYLRIETTLTNTYTVYKSGVTSFDDGDAATSYIAYSTNSTYLNSAKSKISATSYQTYHQHNTSLKTNYLVCEYKSYTASFNGNGGTNGSSITKKYSKALGTLPTSTRTGYTFNGWYTATSGGTKISSSTTMPAQNTTYYAQWTINTYTVEFAPNGGSVSPTSKTITYNSAYGDLPTPTRAGYTFLGWNSKNVLDLSTSLVDPSYTTLVNSSTLSFNATATVGGVANTINSFKVQRYLNGSYVSQIFYTSTLGQQSFTFTKDSTFNRLRIAVNGSKADSNYIVDASHLVNNQTYTFSFSLDAFNGQACTATVSNLMVEKGSSFTGFQPYYVLSTTPANIAADHTLTAKWVANKIRITLDNQSATSAGTTAFYYIYNTNTYYSNEACTTVITSITKPSKNGYTFGGYYTSTGGGGTQYITDAGAIASNLYSAIYTNTTLYAKWTANKIHITLDKGIGTGGTNEFWYYYNTNAFYSNEACTTSITVLELPTKNGYTFEHYYGDGTCGGNNGERYAGYAYVSYGFAGDLCSDVYKDATLYAKWTANKIHITLYKDGGSGGTDEFWYYFDTATYYSNADCTTVLSAPVAPTKTGYTFLNYHGDGTCGGVNGERYACYDGKGFAGDLHIDIYKDATLYATWQANTYTLTFDGNAPSGSTVTQTAANTTVTYKTTTNLTGNYTASCTGYTFNGYYTATSGGTQVFDNTGAIKASVSGLTNASKQWIGTSDTIIYAQWTANTYTVKFEYNNSSTNTSKLCTYGTAFTVANPTREGYTFSGWTITGMDSCTHYYGTSSSSYSTSTSTSLSDIKSTWFKNLRSATGTVIFQATWSIVKYTVTINYNVLDSTDTETKTVYCNEWFEIPIPTTDYYIFCGWQITGMDGGTHYYGTSTSLFSTTTASSISETKSTHFKNLRVTDGAVSINAVWVASERTVTYKFGGNLGWFDVYDNVNYEQIIPWPTTFIYEGPSSNDYSARFILDEHSYRTMGSTIVSKTDRYSITADPFDGYSVIDAYIYNVDTGYGFYVTDTLQWGMQACCEVELTHNFEITFIVETNTTLNVTLVIANASEYSAYFNHNSALPNSPYTIQVAYGTQITTDRSMISFGNDSIFVIASGGTVDYWSVASDTIVISDMTITVYLTQPKYTVTIVVNSSSLGSVNTSVINNVTHGTSYSSSGSILTVGSTKVTALPKKTSSGFATFSKWSPASGLITSDTTITAVFSYPGGITPFASLQESEFTIDENNAPNGAEVWLDDKFRKLQEQQDTIVDFEGVSF